jgi:murein DD-endopeptidase MepM/ murein hydrolase activator NlpD
VDLVSPDGKVMALAAGTVVFAGAVADPPWRGYGPGLVVVDGDVEGIQSRVLYAHLGRVSVRKGDVMEPGQLVGVLGRVGHVHIELRPRGSTDTRTARDPRAWLRSQGIWPGDVAIRTVVMPEASSAPSSSSARSAPSSSSGSGLWWGLLLLGVALWRK